MEPCEAVVKEGRGRGRVVEEVVEVTLASRVR